MVILFEFDGEVYSVEQDAIYTRQPVVLPSGKIIILGSLSKKDGVWHVVNYQVVNSDHSDHMPLDRVAEILNGYLAVPKASLNDPFD